MKAVVTGAIATFPVGGVAWDYGQYALGLERLGFDVYYLEDTGIYSYDADARSYGEDESYGVGFLAESLAALSPKLGERWHYRHFTGRTHGVSPEEILAAVASADVFLNVSGIAMLRDEYLASRRKVLIDTDPGWNHFVRYPEWDRDGPAEGCASFRAHDSFFTYAERLGESDCELPALGLEWHPTRPPAVVDAWDGGEEPGDRWTTVLTWNNYGRPVEHDGRVYGSKDLEFARIEDLPGATELTLEVAAGGVDPPVERWREKGWSVVDSTDVSRSADDYRSYIRRSRGELSVAKNIYVATRSGWFSCRSACYLAAGRPVVVQDTGWSELIPSGDGLFAFSDADDAVAALEKVSADWPHHAAAAQSVAREHFAAEVVLGDLLERVGIA